MVVGAGEALVSPSTRWRSAGGGEALVVHSLLRRPPLLDRAADQRNEPLHAHVATICSSALHRRLQQQLPIDRDGDFFFLEQQEEHESILGFLLA